MYGREGTCETQRTVGRCLSAGFVREGSECVDNCKCKFFWGKMNGA